MFNSSYKNANSNESNITEVHKKLLDTLAPFETSVKSKANIAAFSTFICTFLLGLIICAAIAASLGAFAGVPVTLGLLWGTWSVASGISSTSILLPVLSFLASLVVATITAVYGKKTIENHSLSAREGRNEGGGQSVVALGAG